jgi:hypothetical protein
MHSLPWQADGDELSASRPRRLTPAERAPGIQDLEGRTKARDD